MIVYYIYALCFIAFSGLGIVFLNAESILALCFFIFFSLIIQNSDAASEGLEDTRQGIQKELVSCMLDAQRHQGDTHQRHIFKKAELLLNAYGLKM